jgi:endonuclease III
MLVACQLVGRASWRVAEGVLAQVRARWPTPLDVANSRGDLDEVLYPLGFNNRRAFVLRMFAGAWVMEPPRTSDEVFRMPGCGTYASETWAIFIEGRRDFRPHDARLLWYVTDGKEGRSG